MPKLDAGDINTLSRALDEAINSSTDMRFIHRLHSLLLVAQGRCVNEVARWFNDDPSTVARWIRHFKLYGVLGLQDDHKSGRPSKLDHDALRKLTQELDQHPGTLGHSAEHWDGKLLASHLEKHYGVSMSVRQCQRLLRQLQPPEENQPSKGSRLRSY